MSPSSAIGPATLSPIDTFDDLDRIDRNVEGDIDGMLSLVPSPIDTF